MSMYLSEQREVATESKGANAMSEALDLTGESAREQSAELLQFPEGGEVETRDGVKPVQRLNGRPRGVGDADIVSLLDPKTLGDQLAKTDARYIHVQASGEDVWLDLGASPDPQVVRDLIEPLLGPNGLVRPDLDWTQAYTLSGNTVSVGAEWSGESPVEAGARGARDVLKQSNDNSNATNADDALGQKMDAIWTVTNNDRDELNPSELPGERRVGESVGDDGEKGKEGAWYNGIRINAAGVPEVKRSPNDTRGDALPKLTMDEYRKMLVRDFNYQGAITTFEAAGGEQAFIDAVLRRFPDGGEELRISATQVWSYATTGADTSGKTDIAEMQGYLYVLDPQIQVSSDSNTKKGGLFNAGTTDNPVMIQGGDAAHGRATILTTRHILANVGFDALEPRSVPIEAPTPYGFSDRDRFIRDNSGSMTPKWTSVVDIADKQLGQGAYGPGASVDSKVDATFGGTDEREIRIPGAAGNPNVAGKRDAVQDFSQVLESAFERLYPEPNRDAALAFAKLFGITSIKDIFVKSGRDYALDGAALRREIGDVDPKNANKDAHGESSLKAMLVTLLYHPEYSEATLAKLSPSDRPRLNVMADESEQSLEYLELAKALADALKIEVRLLAVPTKATVVDADMAMIDLQSMNLTPDPSASGDKVGTLTYSALINGVQTPMSVQVDSKLAKTFRGTPSMYKKASVPLAVDQRAAHYNE